MAFPVSIINGNVIPSMVDNQIAGVQDDGSAAGVVRAKILSGELVRVRPSTVGYTVTGGSSTTSFTDIQNEDLGSETITLSNASGNTWVQSIICGRTIGIRFRRTNTTPIFNLIVDGIVYPVMPPDSQSKYLNVNGTQDYGTSMIVVTDLEDRPHSVQIMLNDTRYTLTSANFIFYGFLAEKRAGYINESFFDAPIQVTLVNAATKLNRTSNLYGVKSVTYTNTDNVIHTVTLRYNSIVVYTKTLEPGESDTFKFGNNGAAIGTSASAMWDHFIDVLAGPVVGNAGTVLATIFEGK